MRFLCVAWGTTFTGRGQDNAFSDSCLPTLHAANATGRQHRRKWQHSRSCGVPVCWLRLNGQCFGSPDKWASGGRAQTARRTRLKSGHVMLGERRLSSPALILQLATLIDAIDKHIPKIFSLCGRLRLPRLALAFSSIIEISLHSPGFHGAPPRTTDVSVVLSRL
jgi:hypothetical protein